MAERLPCGCVIDTVDGMFVMKPCGPDCEYYRYAMDESRRQGKPMHPIVDPDITDEDKVRNLLRAHGFGSEDDSDG